MSFNVIYLVSTTDEYVVGSKFELGLGVTFGPERGFPPLYEERVHHLAASSIGERGGDQRVTQGGLRFSP